LSLPKDSRCCLTASCSQPGPLPAKTLATGNRRSLLFADKAKGLILDGPGTIDGQGKLVKMTGKEAQRPSLLRVFNSDNVIVRNLTLAHPACGPGSTANAP